MERGWGEAHSCLGCPVREFYWLPVLSKVLRDPKLMQVKPVKGLIIKKITNNKIGSESLANEWPDA